MKLPISRSSVKPCTPLPSVRYDHRGGAVKREAGRDLLGSRLQEVRLSRVVDTFGARRIEKMVPTVTLTSMLEEPSSGSNSEQVPALRIFRRNGVGLFHLLGRHAAELAAPLTCLEDDLVRDEVERLLVFALDVDARRSVVPRDQCPARDGRCNELARGLNVVEQRGQFGVRIRASALSSMMNLRTSSGDVASSSSRGSGVYVRYEHAAGADVGSAAMV